MARSMSCRRVRDCVALLHNYIAKWKSLTQESFDLICGIVNSKQSKSRNIQTVEGVALSNEAEHDFTKLLRLVEEMVSSIIMNNN